jgi:LysR family nitrogen assimilation transcriptional regulator
VPYLNETYGSTLSGLVMSGRMSFAVLYDGKAAVHGLRFVPLLKERLCVVAPDRMPAPEVPVRGHADVEPDSTLKQVIAEGPGGAGMPA